MIIVSSSNDNYAQHLGVMLTSLLENNKHRNTIDIYIIDGDISPVSKKKLQRVVGRFNKEITFVKLNNKWLDGTFTTKINSKYITRETYYRILIPDVLNRNITKALYLDCDLIVQSDLTKLWHYDIRSFELAAVNIRKKRKLISKKIPNNPYYFNAGVLLMNLDKWRRKKRSRQVLNYLSNHPKQLDQDALNIVFQDKWLKLDPTWNYTTVLQRRLRLKKPTIVHFTGSKKPWNSDHPYKKEYLRYLKSSLWEQDI